MKIGVLSDTHIPETAAGLPEEILVAFKKVDMVLHAGDLVSMSVIAQLKKSCPHVTAVWGNMDPHEVRKELREKEVVSAGNHKIGLMHGWGNPAGLIEVVEDAFKGTGVAVIVFGHSHQPTQKQIGGITYFNPGSPTDSTFAPYRSYGIIEINNGIETHIIKLKP